MATLTVDETKAEAKAKVMEAVEEAKRAVAKHKHQLEDLRDDATYKIRKAPLTAVGLGFGAGIVLGALFGIVAVKAAKKEVKLSTPCC